MNEIAIVAVTTFFATIGPLDVSAVFAAITASTSLKARRSMALRGTTIGAVILILVALAGESLLGVHGIARYPRSGWPATSCCS